MHMGIHRHTKTCKAHTGAYTLEAERVHLKSPITREKPADMREEERAAVVWLTIITGRSKGPGLWGSLNGTDFSELRMSSFQI